MTIETVPVWTLDVAKLLELLNAVRDPSESEPTPREAAEVIWLASRIRRSAGAAARPLPQDSESVTETTPTTEPIPAEPDKIDDRKEHHEMEEDDESIDNHDSEPETDLSGADASIYAGSRSDSMPRVPALPIRAPGAPGLPGTLRIARAFRPLMRRVPSKTRFVLDELATAERIADEGIAAVVMQPERSRWFDLALIIDRSGAMRMWTRTVAELREVLDRHGAFRDVRAWDLAEENGTIRLIATGSATRSADPRELIEPAGRRLFAIVSDCVAARWSDGRMAALIAAWGEKSPVVVLNILPRHLWNRSGIGRAVPVRLRASGPGSPNATLCAETISGRAPMTAGATVAVTTLETARLADWSRFLAGAGGVRAEGYILRLRESMGESELRRREAATGKLREAPPELRVQRFDVLATSQAQELARLFAAVPFPLTLPIMRVVQQTMMPGTDFSVIAEVLLGGLMTENSQGDDGDPERTKYNFKPGIRERLLDAAVIPDSVEIMRTVSRFVGEHFGQTVDFSAWLPDPTAPGPIRIAEGDKPFAQIGSMILRRLGGQYRQLAQRIDESIEYPPPSTPHPSSRMTTRARFAHWCALDHARRPRVELAAYLGNKDAKRLLGRDAPRIPRLLADWVAGLRRWGVPVMIRAAIAAAEQAHRKKTSPEREEFLKQARRCLSDRSPDYAARSLEAAQTAPHRLATSSAALALAAAASPFASEWPAASTTTARVVVAITAAQRETSAADVRKAITSALMTNLLREESLVPDLLPDAPPVLVFGSGFFDVPPLVEWTALEVGRSLASAGHHLIVGGYPGVDHIVSRAVVAQTEMLGYDATRRMTQIVPQRFMPEFRAGMRVVVESSQLRSAMLARAPVVISIGGYNIVYEMLREASANGRVVFPLPWTGDSSTKAFDAVAPNVHRRVHAFIHERDFGSLDELSMMIRRLMNVLAIVTDAEMYDTWRRYSGTMRSLIDAQMPSVDSEARTPRLNAYLLQFAGFTGTTADLDSFAPRLQEWLVYDYIAIADTEPEWEGKTELLGILASSIRTRCRHLALDWLGKRLREASGLSSTRWVGDLPLAAEMLFEKSSELQEWLVAAVGITQDDLEFRSALGPDVRALAEAALLLSPLSVAERKIQELRALIRKVPPARIDAVWPYVSSSTAAVRVIGYVLLQEQMLHIAASSIAELLASETDRSVEVKRTRPLWQLLSVIRARIPLWNKSDCRIIARALSQTMTRLKKHSEVDPGGQCKALIDTMLRTKLQDAVITNRKIAQSAAAFDNATTTPFFPQLGDALIRFEHDFSAAELATMFHDGTTGERLLALAIAPSSAQPVFDLVRSAITNPRSKLEQTTAIVAAYRMLTRFEPSQLLVLHRLLTPLRHSGALQAEALSYVERVLARIDATIGETNLAARRVAIIGSDKSVRLRQFCQMLGRELADAGFDIITGPGVGLWVAEGFAERTSNRSRVILIDRWGGPLVSNISASTHVVASSSIAAYQRELVSHAAAAVAIGGRFGTAQEAELIRSKKLPLIALAGAGGTAQTLSEVCMDDLAGKGVPREWLHPLTRERLDSDVSATVVKILTRLFEEPSEPPPSKSPRSMSTSALIAVLANSAPSLKESVDYLSWLFETARPGTVSSAEAERLTAQFAAYHALEIEPERHSARLRSIIASEDRDAYFKEFGNRVVLAVSLTLVRHLPAFSRRRLTTLLKRLERKRQTFQTAPLTAVMEIERAAAKQRRANEFARALYDIIEVEALRRTRAS